jgi:hypothetical protein
LQHDNEGDADGDDIVNPLPCSFDKMKALSYQVPGFECQW